MNSHADNITASLENSRNCLRRIARNDDTEFSHQSVFNLMEKFVKSVNTMDETILVPCRLMDLKVGDEQDPTCPKKHNQKTKHTVQDLLCSVDLFQVYNMLHSIKADLLWGQGPEEVSMSPSSTVNANTNNSVKGHVRRPSTVSVASTHSSTSSTLSDSESDAGNENDSGIEESQEYGDRSEEAAQNFRRHLHGLTRSLKQMTEAAQYLTSRYQHDIGGPV